LSLFILWVPPFSYQETFYCFLGDPWAKHLKVSSFGFYLLPATFTPLTFSPFFPQGKVQPLTSLENPMPEPMQGTNEREDDQK
jgi:hypothetical protein